MEPCGPTSVAYCRSRFLVLMCLGAWRETTCALSVTCCPTQSNLTLDKFNVVGISTLSKVAEHSSTQMSRPIRMSSEWDFLSILNFFSFTGLVLADVMEPLLMSWQEAHSSDHFQLYETGIQIGTHCYWQGKHHEDILQVPLLSHLYVQQFKRLRSGLPCCLQSNCKNQREIRVARVVSWVSAAPVVQNDGSIQWIVNLTPVNSAPFVITSANSLTFKSSRIRTINWRFRLTFHWTLNSVRR